jgi:mannose-6-phosphate isomerase-like protein (cupin superfamily)
MQAFEIADLMAQQVTSGENYLEFLRSADLSVGIYSLPAGAVDGQQPHTEDEVYYVVKGRGMFFHAGENRPVKPGSVLFVAANVEHRFHSITEDMQILVFFAPAEYARQAT